MRTALVSSLVLVALLAGPRTAAAQQTGQDAAPTAEPEPAYPGVIPGADHDPPAARRASRQNRAVVTWPGFHAGVSF